MVKVAIVDNEKAIINEICSLIESSNDMKCIIETFEHSIKFFQKINNILCDIVFLDIDMPEMNGFDIAKILNNIRPDITIIFVSSFDNFVFESFEYHPFRFVRKSNLKEDIDSALNAYQREIERKKDVYFFKTNEAERSVKTSDIMYFESMGHDIFIYTVDGNFKIKRERDRNMTVKFITEKFENKGFIRVHKSFLVNYRYIHTINYSNIILKNNLKININPRKANDIKKIYQKFIMNEV